MRKARVGFWSGRAAPLLAILAAWLWCPKAANAAANLNYHGGVFKDYMVDLIFVGPNFSTQDKQDALDYVKAFARYLNGELSPPGLDPAIRYYGLWGIIPGLQISDNGPQPIFENASTGAFEVQGARTGGAPFGNALDFAGNVVSTALPGGTNRLAIVLTKGLPASGLYDENCGPAPGFFFDPCTNLDGFHDAYGDGNNKMPYAVVRWEALNTMSHEIQEAMTDPYTFSSLAWATDEGTGGFTHEEACDESCNFKDMSIQIRGSTSNRDISGINPVILDPSYGGLNSIPSDTCRIWEPQQYAPLAVTTGNGSAVTLVYRTFIGSVAAMSWLADSSTPSGPSDLGALGSGVIAQGKPAIVSYTARVAGSGEYVFVRGSDNALWMNANRGGWQSLGGLFYGDPSAVIWDGGGLVNAFVLGTDSNLYTYGIVQGVRNGWVQVPSQGPLGHVLFSGPPKVITRVSSGNNPGDTIDLFAVAEGGPLYTIPFSLSGGWSSAILLHAGFTEIPTHTPVGVTSWGPNELDVVTTTETDVSRDSWNGSSWSIGGSITGSLGSSAPSGTPAIVSWGTNRLDVFMIDRKNALRHAYFDGSWHQDPGNPLATDAVGDPIAVSRGSQQVEVFYRTGTASLSHLYFNSTGWHSQKNVLPANSVH